VFFRRRLEEREAGHGGEVDGCHVGVVGRIPFLAGLGIPKVRLQSARGGGIGDTFGTGDAGGGDKKGEVFFFGGDFFDHFFEGVFRGYVRGDGDDLAGGDIRVWGVRLGGILKDFVASACDVYFGSYRGGSVRVGTKKLVDVPLAART